MSFRPAVILGFAGGVLALSAVGSRSQPQTPGASPGPTTSAPSEETDAEWAALDAAIKKYKLTNLQPADYERLATVLSNARSRGEWLLTQARDKWKRDNDNKSPAEFNRGIDDFKNFVNALPRDPGGARGVTDDDLKKWTDALVSLEKKIQIPKKKLLEITDVQELRGVIVPDKRETVEWPTGPIDNNQLIKLWGRGLDYQKLDELQKDKKLKLEDKKDKKGAVLQVLKAIETLPNPGKKSTFADHVKRLKEWPEQQSDNLTKHTLHIAIALQGRAIGADEDMLKRSGFGSLPTTAAEWLGVASELEAASASAWRLAALAKMLAALASGAGVAEIARDYQRRFAQQTEVDQRIVQWLTGVGTGPGLAPFGSAFTYDSVGLELRKGCDTKPLNDALRDAQKAKAAIFGKDGDAAVADVTSIRRSIEKGYVVVEIVMVPTAAGKQFVAIIVGKTGDPVRKKFDTAEQLLEDLSKEVKDPAKKKDMAGKDGTLTGLFISPDRGMWPDERWIKELNKSKVANWYAIIPSSASVSGGFWDEHKVKQLYWLENNGWDVKRLSRFIVPDVVRDDLKSYPSSFRNFTLFWLSFSEEESGLEVKEFRNLVNYSARADGFLIWFWSKS